MTLRLSLAFLLALPLAAQNSQMASRDFLALSERVLQLVQSTSATAPGLARAAAPLVENLIQDDRALRLNGRPTIGGAYGILANTRAYLLLSDGVPKQAPLSATARQQFSELREAADTLEANFRLQLAQTEVTLRGSDRDNVRRYAEANKTLPAATRDRVVFYGDSITDLWRLNEYFPGKDYVNRGISGQITSEMLGRMQADVVNLKPATMLLLAGTNDIARGVSLETILNNLTMIGTLCEQNGIKVILASVLPTSDHHKDVNPYFEMTRLRPNETIRELNKSIAALCQKRGYTYLNYANALIDPSGQLKSDFADDGLHPGPDGYRVMAPLAQAAIEKVLGGVRMPQQTGKRKRQ